MANKESQVATALFSEEKQFLNHANEMISNMDDENICWPEEYKILLKKYEKLLRQSNKLVRISDHAQKRLHMANEEINEKVVKLTRTEKKLKQMADTDMLTKLPNRRGSFTQIKEELKRADRNGRFCTLLLLDIDHFKRVNDIWGHSAGDFVLKEAARLMRRSLRTQDILGRWGGEEFIILLPRTELEGAKVLSEKVRRTIEDTTMNFEGKEIHITISIGGTLHPPGADLEKHLELADKALYCCKETGRNKVEFYEN
jgi:diguanylate cyclase